MTLEYEMDHTDLDSELVEISDLKVEDLLDFARYGEIGALSAILESEYAFKLAMCDDQNISLLHMVSANGHLECANLLLKCPGVYENVINLCNMEGNTALHWAVLNSHVSIVRLLLENGADVNIKNKNERTAFDEAVAAEKFDITSAIIEYLESSQGKGQSAEESAAVATEELQVTEKFDEVVDICGSDSDSGSK